MAENYGNNTSDTYSEDDVYTVVPELQEILARLGTAETGITVNQYEIETRVEKDGVISVINQSPEEIKIDVAKLNITGLVTISDLAGTGTTTIDGSNIKTGSISANFVKGGTLQLLINSGVNHADIYGEVGGDGGTLVLSAAAVRIDNGGILDLTGTTVRGLTVSFG